MAIPKRIFTYWQGAPMPTVVKLCLEKMRRLHPDWHITVMEEPPEPLPTHGDEIPVQLHSDFARLCALSEHGGVWLDASCMCLEAVTAWVELESESLQVFQLWDDCPENWAFACPPGLPFMKRWKEEYSRALAMGCENWWALAPEHIREHTLGDYGTYLTMHATFLHVVAGNLPPLQIVDSATARRAPYHYLSTKDWAAQAACEALLTDAQPYYMVKLRSEDRAAMDVILESDRWPSRGSVLWRFLSDLLPPCAVHVRVLGEAPPGRRSIGELFPSALRGAPRGCPRPRGARLECCIHAGAQVRSPGRMLAALRDLAREPEGSGAHWAQQSASAPAAVGVVVTRSDGQIFWLDEELIARALSAPTRWPYLLVVLGLTFLLFLLILGHPGRRGMTLGHTSARAH